MKYTKKPVTIDAIQWNGETDVTFIKDWVESFGDDFSKWFMTGTSLKILTLESDHKNAFVVSNGDYIIRGLKGEYYACKPDIFAASYDESKGAKVHTFLEELDRLQDTFYKDKTHADIVGLLGLFGEAGEVLNEVFLIDNSDDQIKAEDLKILAVETAAKLDALKKEIRKPENVSKLRLKYRLTTDLYDMELADCFYYLNILRKNRGLSFNDLAEMSLKKIAAKGAAAKG